MFLGKINSSNKHAILVVLESIQSGGIDGLIMNLFPTENRSLLRINVKSSLAMLDFLFYRTKVISMRGSYTAKDYNKLAIIKYLLKSESSTFIVDVCKYYYAEFNQVLAQQLPSPITKGNWYNLQKYFHILLQNGTKIDAVSGWLLYASYYYVTGKFHITLRLTDYVLSIWSPDMMLDSEYDWELHTRRYRQNTHSTITLNDRMKMYTIRDVIYTMNSSLIPKELQLEVETGAFFIPPIVMSHCLNFLSYHHLGDIVNRQKSLHDLHLTVKNRYSISTSCLSDSITIVGICYEISGAKDTAYQCYEEALQMGCHFSRTADIRKSKLLSNTFEF
ncbi:uncharacterized protein LOC134689688 [Mytilus trossulus]|uniref:uncharacterized protein LOC134689688 n=1 Tax=Mytilus trossulus TaxID=6551 RepID=UPI0030063B1D